MGSSLGQVQRQLEYTVVVSAGAPGEVPGRDPVPGVSVCVCNVFAEPRGRAGDKQVKGGVPT